MIETFINYLMQFGTLNPQQIELVRAVLTVRTYKAGDYFLRAGHVSNEIGFIAEGIFRVCYYEQNGDEVTRYFLDEHNMMVDLESYNSGIPTMAYVEAVVDATVLILSREAMKKLSGTIIIWDKIIHKISVRALAEKGNRISLMFPKDATERYQFFLEKFPNLANRVPLQYIASYIGITKHSLSRIRKNSGKKSK